MKKEYVFHGSPIKVEKLILNQAYDIEYKEGCQYAVYATTNKIMAILFSMGCEIFAVKEFWYSLDRCF